MQRTRQQILDYTNRHGPATVDVLAAELGVVPVTVRAHIAILEKENLLTGQEVRNGRAGRPRIFYSLTEEANKLFPKSYDRLTTRLLDSLVEEKGVEEIYLLFERLGRAWGDEVAQTLGSQGLEERVARVTETLDREGCEPEWERRDDAILLRLYNCPYSSVVEEYPQICRLEQSFLEQTLRLPVEILESGPKVHCCMLSAGPISENPFGAAS